MTVTVGGLYLTTYSVIVTIVGTAAASLLTCWTLRLVRREHTPDEEQHQLPTREASDTSNPS